MTTSPVLGKVNLVRVGESGKPEYMDLLIEVRIYSRLGKETKEYKGQSIITSGQKDGKTRELRRCQTVSAAERTRPPISQWNKDANARQTPKGLSLATARRERARKESNYLSRPRRRRQHHRLRY
jgi:hypothetical protein